jgi:hypothetical protein
MERKDWSRFEMLISRAQKKELEWFAGELDLTPSALVRLAIARLIQDPEIKLRSPPRGSEAA